MQDAQIDADIETTSKDYYRALHVILNNRYAIASTMMNPGKDWQAWVCLKYVKQKLYQVDTVTQIYSRIIVPVASNKNQMFRQTTLNITHEILKQTQRLLFRKKANPPNTTQTKLVHLTHKVDAPWLPILAFHVVRCMDMLAVFDCTYAYTNSSLPHFTYGQGIRRHALGI